MPRSFRDWVNAQKSFAAQYYQELREIGEPDGSYIIYERKSNNPFWEERRQEAENLLSKIDLNPPQNVFDYISQMSKKEREKEIKFLQTFGPAIDPDCSDKELVDNFNSLLQGQERFNRLKERIKEIQRILKEEDPNFKGMAPTLEALYGSYLESRLVRVFAATNFLNKTDKEIDELVDRAIDKAIIDTIKEMEQKGIINAIYGTSADFTPVVRELEESETARDLFITNMKKAIGYDPIKQLKKELKKRDKTKSTRKKLKETLKTGTLTASLGGHLIENTMTAVVKQAFKDSKNITVEGGAITGEQLRTDSVLLFSREVSVDMKKIFDDINSDLTIGGFSVDAFDAFDKVRQFYEDHEDEMEDLFMIYTNAKNYSLGAEAHDFQQSVKKDLSELPRFLNQNGFDTGKAYDFLNMVYNTAKGAVFYQYREEIDEALSKMVAAGAARLMFDDYQTLGQGGMNTIHLYQLDSMYVPVSIVYKSMAEAGKELATIRGTIIFPDEINDLYDPGKKSEGWGYLTEEEYSKAKAKDSAIKTAIWKHWNDEKDRIRSSGYWNASFNLKIKKAILSFI